MIEKNPAVQISEKRGCCAHSRVSYRPIELGPHVLWGLTDSWQCDDCDMRFQPLPPGYQNYAEIRKMIAILDAFASQEKPANVLRWVIGEYPVNHKPEETT